MHVTKLLYVEGSSFQNLNNVHYQVKSDLVKYLIRKIQFVAFKSFNLFLNMKNYTIFHEIIELNH